MNRASTPLERTVTVAIVSCGCGPALVAACFAPAGSAPDSEQLPQTGALPTRSAPLVPVHKCGAPIVRHLPPSGRLDALRQRAPCRACKDPWASRAPFENGAEPCWHSAPCPVRTRLIDLAGRTPLTKRSNRARRKTGLSLSRGSSQPFKSWRSNLARAGSDQ